MLVDLSEKDVRMLLRCTRREIGKLAHALARSTYVPPPGKGDSNQVALDKATDLHARLEQALAAVE